MAITWKQIDTNGNGYVDCNEMRDAKQKGVKNVWNSMTEQDFNNNTTRTAKLRQLYSNLNEQYIIINIGKADENHCCLDISNSKNYRERRSIEASRAEENMLKIYSQIEVLEQNLHKKEEEFSSQYGIIDWIKSAFVNNEKYTSDKNEIETLKSTIAGKKEELQKMKDLRDAILNNEYSFDRANKIPLVELI